MSSYSPRQGAMHRARQADTKASTPQEVARPLAWPRREFLRNVAGIALGSSLLPSSLLARTGIPSSKRKVVVITFGGGARDQETFAPEGQENIPHLMRELIPQSAFFTQVVNRGILGHYVATDRKSTRLNSSHSQISYAVFCLKKKKYGSIDRNPVTSSNTRMLWIAK